jgi:phage shock protein C
MNRRLYRSPDDRILAGVAGGMAETYDFDPALVRVGWALLILVTGGVFLLLYIVMALVVPLRPSGMMPWPTSGMTPPPGTPPGPEGAPDVSGAAPAAGPMGNAPAWTYRRRGRNDATGPIVIGLLLILAGGFFLARQFIPAFNWGLIWPLLIVAGGLLLIVVAFGRTRSES